MKPVVKQIGSVMLLVLTALTIGLANPVSAVDLDTFHGLSPARLGDTRLGQPTIDGLHAGTGKVLRLSTRNIPVTGRGGVPSAGVGSVAINVTVTGALAGGYFTVFPTGSVRPEASNLNFSAGQTIANMVIIPVGTGGQVSFYNAAGAGVDFIVDVLGWFPVSPSFTGLNPGRLLDTRPGYTTIDGISAGAGATGPGATTSVVVAGRATVPASGVGAVALNVTITGPTRPGYLTVFPTGTALPTASNLNFTPGVTVANMVIVPVGAGGSISIFNGSTGTSNLIVDVLGWFPPGFGFSGLSPARIGDTRTGQPTADGRFRGQGRIAGETVWNVKTLGRGGVPASGVGAVALNITATNPSSGGYLTVYPAGAARPNASNLNFVVGQTIPNMVIVPVGTAGEISIYTATGMTDVIVDVLGWFPNPTIPASVYGNTLTLRSTSIGDAPFGLSPAPTIAYLQSVLGPPTTDFSEAFPVFNGGYYFAPNEDAFEYPFGRGVCFNGGLCAYFGGASVASLAFRGYAYSGDPLSRLFDEAGLSVNALAADYPAAMSYTPGGCFSYGSGTSTSGINLVLYSRGLEFTRVTPAGEYINQLPAASDVFIVDMTAGALITAYSDC
jgi:hypothetical protein